MSHFSKQKHFHHHYLVINCSSSAHADLIAHYIQVKWSLMLMYVDYTAAVWFAFSPIMLIPAPVSVRPPDPLLPQYSSAGCLLTLHHSEKPDHEEVCEFRPYTCPCPGATCKWHGSLEAVMPHLMHAHKSITTLQVSTDTSAYPSLLLDRILLVFTLPMFSSNTLCLWNEKKIIPLLLLFVPLFIRSVC